MKKTILDYPNLLAQWHPTKNGDLKPNDVMYSSNKKMWWKCPVADDHEWEATVNNRTNINNRNKGGCPCCLGRKIVLSNCLIMTHSEIAKQWHSTKNEELTIYDVGSGSRQLPLPQGEGLGIN